MAIRILNISAAALAAALAADEAHYLATDGGVGEVRLRQPGVPPFEPRALLRAAGLVVPGVSDKDVQRYRVPSRKEVAREIRSLRDRIFSENTRDGARVRGLDGKFVPTEEFRLRARALNRLFEEFCRRPRKAA